MTSHSLECDVEHEHRLHRYLDRDRLLLRIKHGAYGVSGIIYRKSFDRLLVLLVVCLLLFSLVLIDHASLCKLVCARQWFDRHF